MITQEIDLINRTVLFCIFFSGVLLGVVTHMVITSLTKSTINRRNRE